MKKLRIATMVTGYFTVPQPKGIVYAPIDLMLEIVNGLAERGHDITVYAPEGSKLSAGKLVTSGLKPLEQEMPRFLKNDPTFKTEDAGKLRTLWAQSLIARMFEAAEDGQYDLLHIHPVDNTLPVSLAFPSVPTVFTLHDPIWAWRNSLYRLFLSPNKWYVSISNAQRQPAPDLPYIKTIYNGIRLENFPFSDEPGEYLLFVGRLVPQKGVAEAIAIAKKLGEKLIIIGPQGPIDYWENKIKPHLSDTITHIGFIDREKLYMYYKNAKALLMPIQWEEPFGLVMTEAMACGTPVVGLRRGSVPEVVVDGKTGFIVDTLDQMVKAIKKVDTIDPKACRQHVEENFSIAKMVDAYEAAYYSILERHGK